MSHKIADVVTGCNIAWIKVQTGTEAVEMLANKSLDIGCIGSPACSLSALSRRDDFISVCRSAPIAAALMTSYDVDLQVISIQYAPQINGMPACTMRHYCAQGGALGH